MVSPHSRSHLPHFRCSRRASESPNNSGLPTPREEVLDLVSLHVPNLHVCVTGRPEIDIQTVLEPLTSLRISLHNQTGQMEDYVSSVVYSDKKMGRWHEEDRKLVIETLSTEIADGMYGVFRDKFLKNINHTSCTQSIDLESLLGHATELA